VAQLLAAAAVDQVPQLLETEILHGLHLALD
jgi:hypothetical protein